MPPRDAEPRIELGPALQQADALPTELLRSLTELRRILTELRRTLTELRRTLNELRRTLTELRHTGSWAGSVTAHIVSHPLPSPCRDEKTGWGGGGDVLDPSLFWDLRYV